MSIWNKILLGLIFITSVVFFVAAVRVLRTHEAWHGSYEKHVAALEKVAQESLDLTDGTPRKPGMRQWKVALSKLMAERGRVWPNITAHRFDAAGNRVMVATTLPPPHPTRSADVQLFLFEEAPEGQVGAYLGEFTVKSVGNEWTLAPTWTLSAERRTRLEQSKLPWLMCEVLPASIPGFRPEDIQRPEGEEPAEASPRDAAKREAQPGPPEGVKYEVLFTDYYRQMSVLRDEIGSLTADNAALDDAEAKAQQRIGELKKEITEVTADLGKARAARDAVADHRKAVAAKLAEVETAIAQTKEANRIAAAEIAAIQLEATKRIDERTRRMVQVQAGGSGQ
jgi:hypothetical protein